MFSTFTTIVLIASLLLGGGGATVAAAQNSQPNQLLYGVKVLSEDVRIGLSADPQSEYLLALEFANRRAAEIQKILQDDNTPPEMVQTRYQSQVEQAIQFAVNLPDDQAVRALEQIHAQLQTQQQTFLQFQAKGSAPTDATILLILQMLHEQLQLVEAGLTNPTQLRDQLHLRDQQRILNRQVSTTPGSQSTQVTPGTGDGNPWTTGTPTPGSGYGPGKGTGGCDNCTPTSTGQGGNPWTTGTPTPGSGYGPGPGPELTSTRTPGSGYGSGLQPTQSQNNQPTQAGPQSTQQQKNQPTQAAPQPAQQNKNQPTEADPQPAKGSQSAPSGSGAQSAPTGTESQSTTAPGGQGGKR